VKKSRPLRNYTFFDADAPERAVVTPTPIQPSASDDAAWDWNGDDLSPKLIFDPFDGAATPGHPNYDAEWAEFWHEACATAERERVAAVEQAQDAAESDARRYAAAAPLPVEIVRTGALPPPEARLWPPETPLDMVVQQMRAEGYADTAIITAALYQDRWNQTVIGAAVGVSQSQVSWATRRLRKRAEQDHVFAQTLPLCITKPKVFAARTRRQHEAELNARLTKLRAQPPPDDADDEEGEDDGND